MRDEQAFEPEQIVGRFAAVLTCVGCKADIGIAGEYRVQDDRHIDPEFGEGGDYVEYYRPRYFTDSPRLIECPPATPVAVLNEIAGSFQQYWSDPNSCANRIRSSVELLLTDQRVPKSSGRDKEGRWKFLKLHSRIERFAQFQQALAEKLMAVKWLGNAGSHSDSLDQDDLLDGYEILAFVLDELYSDRKRRVESLTRSINRRKAPRSHRRRQKP
jgi:hypothetical protein